MLMLSLMFCCVLVPKGFYIPELNIMLDAGPTSLKNPDHIFITHNHVDHVAGVLCTIHHIISFESLLTCDVIVSMI